jgi:crotonobetainyl-CoA:carnitine CoA-transferase CaiB-like acyl-CoA transferase
MIGKPEWADDPEFATYAARLKNRDRLTRMLDEVLMARDTADWLGHFSGRVPAAPVNDIAQALENPFLSERDGIQDYRYLDGRAARMVACPIRVAGAVLPTRAAPALGADTPTLLEETGYKASEVAELKRMGVLS